MSICVFVEAGDGGVLLIDESEGDADGEEYVDTDDANEEVEEDGEDNGGEERSSSTNKLLSLSTKCATNLVSSSPYIETSVSSHRASFFTRKGRNREESCAQKSIILNERS